EIQRPLRAPAEHDPGRRIDYARRACRRLFPGPACLHARYRLHRCREVSRLRHASMKIERTRSIHGRWRRLLVSAALGTIIALSILVVACQELPVTPVPPATASATATAPASTATRQATQDEPEPPAEASEEPAPLSTEDPAALLDDFELETLPTGQDDFAPIGFVTWSDGSGVAIVPLLVEAGDELALPEQEGRNTILQ